MKKIQFLIIKTFHNIFKFINLNILLTLSYLIGPIYYAVSFKNSFNLHRRKKDLVNTEILNIILYP